MSKTARQNGARVIENVNPGQPLNAMPGVVNLARAVNYCRRCQRPPDPQSLNFDLDSQFIPPDFVVDDIHIDNERHFMFASAVMIRLLGKAKEWYMDRTFKVIKHLSISCFLSIHLFNATAR